MMRRNMFQSRAQLVALLVGALAGILVVSCTGSDSTVVPAVATATRVLSESELTQESSEVDGLPGAAALVTPTIPITRAASPTLVPSVEPTLTATPTRTPVPTLAPVSTPPPPPPRAMPIFFMGLLLGSVECRSCYWTSRRGFQHVDAILIVTNPWENAAAAQ